MDMALSRAQKIFRESGRMINLLENTKNKMNLFNKTIVQTYKIQRARNKKSKRVAQKNLQSLPKTQRI